MMDKWKLGWNGIRGYHLKSSLAIIAISLSVAILGLILYPFYNPKIDLNDGKPIHEYIKIKQGIDDVSKDIENDLTAMRHDFLFWFFAIAVAGIGLSIVWMSRSFICPHCLKSLNPEFKTYACSFCNNQIKNPFELYTFCFHCGSINQYIECEHCHEPIDLFADYDKKKLEMKRYGR